jgi:GntR family transcriptional regulator
MHTHQHSLLDLLTLKNDGVPIYVQIREQTLAAIAAGLLPAGSQMPTMRQVAVTLKVDLNTVRHAYDELQRAGAVTLVRGRGSYVADHAPVLEVDPLEAQALQVMAQAKNLGLDPAALARRILKIATGEKTS